jgi:hypothetical protein
VSEVNAVQVSYCELWSDRLRRPVGQLSEDAARQLDWRGQRYGFVVGDPFAPDLEVTVHWKKSCLTVSFIDDAGRKHVRYMFRLIDEHRLFLGNVIAWEYVEGARYEFEAARIESVLCKPSGYLRRKLEDKNSKTVQISEYTSVPVNSNWEPSPQFGDWGSVIRYERN